MVFKKMKIEDNFNLLSINFTEIINEINKNNFKTDFDLVFNTSDSNISIIYKNIYKNNQAEFYTVITTNAFEIILLNLNKENKNINIIKDLSKNGNIFNASIKVSFIISIIHPPLFYKVTFVIITHYVDFFNISPILLGIFFSIYNILL